ncbi:DUF417 family protein [Bernardetia sp. ABR2-2B]|uniref:DUF417 family protein n=1 Tax=Bernardetia sp. ABR2-2B TaxID=3127472 RepID=UPI0030D3A170
MKALFKLDTIGNYISLYSVSLILLWYGIFKFTPTEAAAIEGLVRSHPLMSWLYNVLSVQGVSNLIGTIEIIAALFIAFFPLSKIISFLGGLVSTLTFIFTVSFLFTMPSMFKVVDGLLVPAGGAGFIIKDLVLLGASVWITGISFKALYQKNATIFNHFFTTKLPEYDTLNKAS